MKKIFLTCLTVLFSCSLLAQEAETTPSPWSCNGVVGLNASATGLVNWAAGGNNNINGVAFGKVRLLYAENDLSWETNLNLEYGLSYIDQKGERGILYIRAQDDWELVSDNLIPFESKVLVRDTNQDLWKPAIYGFLHNKWHYVVGGLGWEQCIPYEGNEHLLGTSNDCSEFYKTWK
jgi:hypothetical protein